jgi:DNA processing protein
MDYPEDLLYKIAVGKIPGMGCKRAKKILAAIGGAEALFKEKKDKLMKVEGIGEAMARKINTSEALELADKELKFIEKYKIQVLYYLDKAYPNRLKHCEDSPLVLFVKGEVDFDMPKAISIVGTRNATGYGRNHCEQLVKKLRERNHDALIISGLAYGIDVAAHKAALKHDLPTVAVLGHSLETIYPATHRNTAKKIIDQGALVSEFLTSDPVEPGNFVRRNRIIAGMADATIVVESAHKGGALITADIANSYNRDVFAFPGRTGDEYSKGCNWLIKTHKAALIEGVEDLEYILNWESPEKKKKAVQKQLFIELSEMEKQILDVILKENEIPIDSICYQVQMPVSKVSPLLLNLEFNGLIRCLPGKVYEPNN